MLVIALCQLSSVDYFYYYGRGKSLLKMGSQIQFHVENDEILTAAANEELQTEQVLKYLEKDLQKFKMGSKFVLVCGVREDPDGNLFEVDRINVKKYYHMFENFHGDKTNNDIVRIVEEKKYKIGTIIQVLFEEKQDGQQFALQKKHSKAFIKKEFKRMLSSKEPILWILVSHKNELFHIFQSFGLFSANGVSEKRDTDIIISGKFFQLDDKQNEFLREISNDDTKKDIIIAGKL